MSITPIELLNSVPDNQGKSLTTPLYWKNVRLIKLEAWNTKGDPVNIKLGLDARSFGDVGVPGSRAAHLHVQSPLLTRAVWYTAGDTNVLANVMGATTIHATVELTT
jgi:hypothetical protein